MIWVVDSDSIALKVTMLTLKRNLSNSEIIGFESPDKVLDVLRNPEDNQISIPKYIISDVHFPLFEANDYVDQLIGIAQNFKIGCIFCTVLPIHHYLNEVPEQNQLLKFLLKPFSSEYIMESLSLT